MITQKRFCFALLHFTFLCLLTCLRGGLLHLLTRLTLLSLDLSLCHKHHILLSIPENINLAKLVGAHLFTYIQVTYFLTYTTSPLSPHLIAHLPMYLLAGLLFKRFAFQLLHIVFGVDDAIC